MTSQSFTEEEKADILQGLSASIHRLSNKIKNDERNGRQDYNRVEWRKEKIERAEVLIEKFKQVKTNKTKIMNDDSFIERLEIKLFCSKHPENELQFSIKSRIDAKILIHPCSRCQQEIEFIQSAARILFTAAQTVP